jgi:hypothetical protein
MSEDKQTTGAAAGNAAKQLFETLKANPKAIYILIGIIAAGSLTMALTGGGSGRVQVKTTVSSGQTITLENPNGGLSHLTITPGLVSASDSEEDKDQSVCTVAAGTKGTVEEEQVVGLLPFVKVKIADGPCQGNTGWTSKINVKSGQ